jgi:hypothetical protein
MQMAGKYQIFIEPIHYFLRTRITVNLICMAIFFEYSIHIRFTQFSPHATLESRSSLRFKLQDNLSLRQTPMTFLLADS